MSERAIGIWLYYVQKRPTKNVKNKQSFTKKGQKVIIDIKTEKLSKKGETRIF